MFLHIPAFFIEPTDLKASTSSQLHLHLFSNTLSTLVLCFPTVHLYPESTSPPSLLPGGLCLVYDGQICQSRDATPSNWYASETKAVRQNTFCPNLPHLHPI